MSMNRRDAFKSLAAIGATAGASAVAVDAAGAVTPPEEAKGKFVIVLRPDRPLPPEAVERLRDQFRDVIKRADIDVPVAILPHGLELSTVKPDGSIESTDRPVEAVAAKSLPWIGEAMLHLVNAASFGGTDDGREVYMRNCTTPPDGDYGSRTVRVMLESRIETTGKVWLHERRYQPFVTYHTIRIDESRNAFNNWDSVDAVCSHKSDALAKSSQARSEELKKYYVEFLKSTAVSPEGKA